MYVRVTWVTSGTLGDAKDGEGTPTGDVFCVDDDGSEPMTEVGGTSMVTVDGWTSVVGTPGWTVMVITDASDG